MRKTFNEFFQEIGDMQPREIPSVDINEILEPGLEPGKPRRRQKVRARPPTSISDREAGVSARKYSLGRFRPRKQEKTSVGAVEVEERKVLMRPRMRRPPSLRSSHQRVPSPPVMKSIKRMRVRARGKPTSTLLTRRPQSPSSLAQSTTLHKTLETSTFKQSPSSSSSSSAVPRITTEVITISPDAHKIRFTLDRNEVTSELPILRAGPSAERLVSNILIPDDIFRQERYFPLSL